VRIAIDHNFNRRDKPCGEVGGEQVVSRSDVTRRLSLNPGGTPVEIEIGNGAGEQESSGKKEFWLIAIETLSLKTGEN